MCLPCLTSCRRLNCPAQADSGEWFDYSPRVNASAPLTNAAVTAWLDKYAAMLESAHDAVAGAAAGAYQRVCHASSFMPAESLARARC